MHPLAELARRALEEYRIRGKILSPPAEPTPEMTEKAGVFVCLKKHGHLRGCIGTFAPRCETVAEETIRNAIAAANEDPRFSSISPEELSDITYSVDVLSPPEKVKSTADLDPKRFGVIVASGGRRGLLLPDIEGVETVAEQLRIARMKAGINPDERVEMYRFEVRRYD